MERQVFTCIKTRPGFLHVAFMRADFSGKLVDGSYFAKVYITQRDMAYDAAGILSVFIGAGKDAVREYIHIIVMYAKCV